MFNQQDLRLVKAFVKVITGYSANIVYLEKINNNLPYTAPKTTIILNINIVSWNIHRKAFGCLRVHIRAGKHEIDTRKITIKINYF